MHTSPLRFEHGQKQSARKRRAAHKLLAAVGTASLTLATLICDRVAEGQDHTMDAKSYFELARRSQNADHQQEALGYAEKARAANQDLATRFPTNSSYRVSLADCYALMAEIHTTLGERTNAERWVLRAIELGSAIERDNPTNETVTSDLARFQLAYARVLINDTNRWREGEKYLLAGEKRATRAADPGAKLLLSAMAHEVRGVFSMRMGDLTEAQRLLRVARREYEVAMDEAFSKLSGNGVENCMSTANALGLQLILAMPDKDAPSALRGANTILMITIQKSLGPNGRVLIENWAHPAHANRTLAELEG